MSGVRPRVRRSGAYWGAGLCLLVLVAAGWWSLRTGPRLNVLLVTLDTTRADHIGCYGYARALTPTLDALADDGVVFESAYATVPLTLPSHTSMLTGLYPPENGMHVNGRGRLDPQLPNLAATLRAAGYRTGAFIASVVLHSRYGLDHGFEVYDDDMAGGEQHGHESHLMRNARLVVDSALRWLDARQTEPFLCWVHLFDPHAPYDSHPETFGDRFEGAAYDGDIAFADLHVGRLIRFLKERDLYDKTLIVVVGDHGEGLGEHLEEEHGFMLYNTTVRVPLIISNRSLCRAGHRVPTPVSQVDLPPTILDCLGLVASGPVSGTSLRVALEGEALPPRVVYAETEAVYQAYGWAPLGCLIDEQWKYIETTRPELYNLRDDPQEQHNLAESRPQDVARCRGRYSDLVAEMARITTGDAALTAAERRKLESLGYVSGVRPPPVTGADAPLPDVKDMIVHYNAEFQARELINAGRFDEAIDRLQKTIRSAPGFLPARMTLGKALEGQGRTAEALAVFEQALEIDPEAAGPHFELGKHFAAAGDAARAIEHYQAAIRLDPDDAAIARFNLGGVLLAQGDVDEAREQYELGLEEFPDSIVGQFNFSVLLAGQGELDRAIAHARRAAELGPYNPQVQFQLGKLLASQGNLPEAVAQFERTLRLVPGDPNVTEALNQARQALHGGG